MTLFQSPVAVVADEMQRKLCEVGTSYILIYTDVMDVATGRMDVRIGSNYPVAQLGGVLGGLLEPSDEFKRMLRDFFLANPLRVVAPVDSGNPPAADAPPEFVEVPTDEAVELFTRELLVRLQLKAAKPKSSLIVSS